MINSDLEIKDKFVEMCRMIFIGSEGDFIFPIDSLLHDENYIEFIEHSDWPILEIKMKNLIVRINENHSILDQDIETEIWHII